MDGRADTAHDETICLTPGDRNESIFTDVRRNGASNRLLLRVSCQKLNDDWKNAITRKIISNIGLFLRFLFSFHRFKQICVF